MLIHTHGHAYRLPWLNLRCHHNKSHIPTMIQPRWLHPLIQHRHTLSIWLCPSMPPMLLPVGIGFTAWPRITTKDISKAPVDHSISVKVLIFSVSHLTQPEMLTIGIDCLNSPIWFGSDQLVKALKFFVIHNPWMCIQLQRVNWCCCFNFLCSCGRCRSD